MKTLILSIGFLFASTLVADQLPDLERDAENTIHLAVQDTASVEYRLNYAGMGGQISNSQWSNYWQSPDCLILHGFFPNGVPTAKLLNVVRQLEIRDGAGILFPGGSHHTKVLRRQVINNTHVFFVNDLSTYVTGIRVATKNGKSLREVVDSEVGHDANLALTYSRACALIRR